MSTHMHPQIVYQITLHYITPYVLPPLFSTKLIVRHQPSLVWKIKTKSSPDWVPKKKALSAAHSHQLINLRWIPSSLLCSLVPLSEYRMYIRHYHGSCLVSGLLLCIFPSKNRAYITSFCRTNRISRLSSRSYPPPPLPGPALCHLATH